MVSWPAGDHSLLAPPSACWWGTFSSAPSALGLHVAGTPQGHPRLWTERQAALGAMNGGRIRSHPVLSCIRRPGVTGTLGPDTLMLVSLAMWEKIANPCYQPDEFEIWVMLF